MARLEEGVGGIYCSGGRSWDSHPRARPGIDLDVLFAFPPFFPLQFLYLSRFLLLSFPPLDNSRPFLFRGSLPFYLLLT